MRTLNEAAVRTIAAGETVNLLDVGTGLLISRVPFEGFMHVGLQAVAAGTMTFSLDINGRRIAQNRPLRTPGADIPTSDPTELDLVNIPILPSDRGGQVLFEVTNNAGAPAAMAFSCELSQSTISR